MGHSHASSFCVVGQFMGYQLKSHKIHRIHLQCDTEEYRLKLSNGARDDLLRAALAGDLQIGDWMQVSGLREMDQEGKSKLTAHAVSRCKKKQLKKLKKAKQAEKSQKRSAAADVSQKPMKVLVCQKSSCCKRGGKAVMKQLKKVVDQPPFEGQVAVKGTGCMGQCSKGPVVVVDKTRYREVKVSKVKRMVEKHLSDRA